jgi:hypothetical protein
MSTVDVISNNQSLKALFSDYITCMLYLGEAKTGRMKISDQVRNSVQKRLDQLTFNLLVEMRKHKYVKNPTTHKLRQAATQMLDSDPSGSDYYLKRLAVR